MDDVTWSDDELTLPHPSAHERAFVLAPWADIDPNACLRGHAVTELLAAVGDAGVRRFAREWVEW